MRYWRVLLVSCVSCRRVFCSLATQCLWRECCAAQLELDCLLGKTSVRRISAQVGPRRLLRGSSARSSNLKQVALLLRVQRKLAGIFWGLFERCDFLPRAQRKMFAALNLLLSMLADFASDAEGEHNSRRHLFRRAAAASRRWTITCAENLFDCRRRRHFQLSLHMQATLGRLPLRRQHQVDVSISRFKI